MLSEFLKNAGGTSRRVTGKKPVVNTHEDAHEWVLATRTGSGGASRDRTDDPLLAKQVLSQLSYGP